MRKLSFLSLAALLFVASVGCGESKPTVIQPTEESTEMDTITDEMSEAAEGDTPD